MRCPNCGCKNREGAKFCNECAAPWRCAVLPAGPRTGPARSSATSAPLPLRRNLQSQRLRTPDSDTQRLIEGYFVRQALGVHTLKGLSQAVELYRVLGESGSQSRFEVAVRGGLTPLVGREEALGLLLQRWERVKEGEGQVVLLSGEAGIGKSRLVLGVFAVATLTAAGLMTQLGPYRLWELAGEAA